MTAGEAEAGGVRFNGRLISSRACRPKKLHHATNAIAKCKRINITLSVCPICGHISCPIPRTEDGDQAWTVAGTM